MRPWIIAICGALMLLPLFGLSIDAARALGIEVPVSITEDQYELLVIKVRLMFGLIYSAAAGAILYRARTIAVAVALVALNITGNAIALGVYHLASPKSLGYGQNETVIYLTAIMAIVHVGLLLGFTIFVARSKRNRGKIVLWDPKA
jgi:hypothetical protein